MWFAVEYLNGASFFFRSQYIFEIECIHTPTPLQMEYATLAKPMIGRLLSIKISNNVNFVFKFLQWKRSHFVYGKCVELTVKF